MKDLNEVLAFLASAPILAPLVLSATRRASVPAGGDAVDRGVCGGIECVLLIFFLLWDTVDRGEQIRGILLFCPGFKCLLWICSLKASLVREALRSVQRQGVGLQVNFLVVIMNKMMMIRIKMPDVNGKSGDTTFCSGNPAQ